jgi:catechol 2,3-dioxygenase-like lactoylglutathione lyase family enzyme
LLGHLSFGVADLARAAAFYDATMMALGYVRVFTSSQSVGYGLAGRDKDKLLLIHKPVDASPPGPGFHLAFVADSRETVDHFHAAALQNGGIDNGAPGLRLHYGPTYYAAFVIDPDGHRLEAVCQ